jgi:hypothetical protein
MWKAHPFDSWDLMASIMNEAAKERDLLFQKFTTCMLKSGNYNIYFPSILAYWKEI